VSSILKIGTAITSQGPNEAIDMGVLAEKLGFDSLWVTDHLIDTGGIKVEPWTTISAIAIKTKKIILGSAVTDTQRSHPARTAHTIATLDEISKGRVRLGIGAGEAMNLLPFGIKFDRPLERVRRLEEAIQIIRLLLTSSREKPISFHGRYFNLRRAWLDISVKKVPPIYVGALGGRNALRLVAKCADGWLTWINSPESFALKMKVIKNVLNMKMKKKKPGRKIDAVVWIYTTMSQSGDKLQTALRHTKRTMLSEAHTLLGFATPKQITPYQNILVEDKVDLQLLKNENMVPDDLAQRFLSSGPASQHIERIEEYRKAGATHVIAHFLDSDNIEAMKKYSREVLSYFHSQKS
jgi:alkanesulfonate monooxygenase SsuD/methylene tetrahydromethanopterin reductase-like flavin-dependent oxidoreductase (luciferase family)